jgi:hypothetical protein
VANTPEQTLASTTLLQALVPTYLTKLPVDPLTHTYWYEYKSDGSTYYLRCVAEDASDTTAHQGLTYSYLEFTNP